MMISYPSCFFFVEVKAKVQAIIFFVFWNHDPEKEVIFAFLELLHSPFLAWVSFGKRCKSNKIINIFLKFIPLFFTEFKDHINLTNVLGLWLILDQNSFMNFLEGKSQISKFFWISCCFWKTLNRIPKKVFHEAPLHCLLSFFFQRQVNFVTILEKLHMTFFLWVKLGDKLHVIITSSF